MPILSGICSLRNAAPYRFAPACDNFRHFSAPHPLLWQLQVLTVLYVMNPSIHFIQILKLSHFIYLHQSIIKSQSALWQIHNAPWLFDRSARLFKRSK